MAPERRRQDPRPANAADHQAVRRAEERAQDMEDERISFYEQIMSHPAGRAVMWDLLCKASVFSSIFHPSGSQLYYNAGRQDFGHELQAELVRFKRLYLAMESEGRERAEQWEERMNADNTPAAGAPVTGSEE